MRNQNLPLQSPKQPRQLKAPQVEVTSYPNHLPNRSIPATPQTARRAHFPAFRGPHLVMSSRIRHDATNAWVMTNLFTRTSHTETLCAKDLHLVQTPGILARCDERRTEKKGRKKIEMGSRVDVTSGQFRLGGGMWFGQ